ncbi:MAG TPA: zf-HC2 domain-containing protein [Ramlibacter sp.]|uniref:zf-HC2 domain-containing protein n=1 Tax=Ramlibacter sp. TaxID=1917967 RepID=UPI002D7E4A4A|nr:zf-HC2 domain-containing protein [Ramlibacter sp.]HET8746635.1 zf-HC2 domain-containing protein [Ramlibacter sp.]
MNMRLSCRRATELLSQQLDRELSLEEKAALKAHLLICRGCRAVDQQFRFLREAVRSLGGSDDPPSPG